VWQAAGLSMSAWVARTIRAAAIAESARRYEQFERESGNAQAMRTWDEARGAEQGRRLAGGEW
jgi:hypothetical protein